MFLFYAFLKGFLKERNMNRDHPWPTDPKIFTIWSSEEACWPGPEHSHHPTVSPTALHPGTSNLLCAAVVSPFLEPRVKEIMHHAALRVQLS